MQSVNAQSELYVRRLDRLDLSGGSSRSSVLRRLEIAADEIRNHAVDEGFVALNNLRMNITADPALEQPRVRAALDRIRGD